jgi:MoaA/NifB/PqqE/SkfB family radical SAM enzyme
LTLINKNTFCSIPFTTISTANDNSYHHCCFSIPADQDKIIFKDYAIKNNQQSPAELGKDNLIDVWNSNFYKQLRKDLITGKQNVACNHCWKREAAGVASHRQRHLNISNKKLSQLNNDFSLIAGPNIIDVKTGNFCNLKCIMCHPVNSTEHVLEIRKMRSQNLDVPSFVEMSEDQLSLTIKQFDSQLFFNSIKDCINDITEFQFYGGEPLATIEVLKFLDLILVSGADPKIKIITNLSITNEKIFSKLEKFSNVELIVSWDHTDPVISNYIRYPIDHAEFLNNLKRVLAHPSYKVAFSPTISIFNIFNIPEMFKTIEDINNNYKNVEYISVNILDIPKYFSLKYLNNDIKKTASDMLTLFLDNSKNFSIFDNGNSVAYQTLQSLINFMNYCPTDYNQINEERVTVLNTYDKIRNTNSIKLFSYLYK